MEHNFKNEKKISIEDRKVAYFSMEIGIEDHIPTYSGGLGILAGDTLRSCADMHVPIIGITLVTNKGYFKQIIDKEGNQTEKPVEWDISQYLKLVDIEITVPMEKRNLYLKVWRYDLKGFDGHIVPIYFLDSDDERNFPQDREITFHLYGGDLEYRLKQEIVLGIGGYKLIKKLGYANINKYHMNEGHSALLTLELRKDIGSFEENWETFSPEISEKVREHCIFTTHTPVPAGHDKFPIDLVKKLLDGYITDYEYGHICENNKLNMTLLAIEASKYINGVAKKHKEVSEKMFPGYEINAITNGIHANFWTSPPLSKLFDRYLNEWKKDPYSLRTVFNISPHEIWDAHYESKRVLMDYINSKYNRTMDPDVFTIGFARRITAYKRPLFFFSDIAKLKEIIEKVGNIQVVFSGKAHPNDTNGKRLIKEIHDKIKELRPFIKIVYLDNYAIDIAKILISGVDLWLNNPQPPKEASGTSGMKAAVNGVPSFSTLDGWWLEGHVENVTGWSIGEREDLFKKIEIETEREIKCLYEKLQYIIMPMFYNKRDEWMKIMQNSIAFNGSFFNTHRMVYQYVAYAYFI
ncbi:alpha-glucan family phosphorylase [bacterium]|nr:alpha-glucan family phosphorylase [bacterium]